MVLRREHGRGRQTQSLRLCPLNPWCCLLWAGGHFPEEQQKRLEQQWLISVASVVSVSDPGVALLSQSITRKRRYVATVSLHDRIYVIGGYDGRSRLSSVECLDYTSDEDGIWYSVAPMNVRRGLAGATTLGGTCWSLPGQNSLFGSGLTCPELGCEEWAGSGGGGEPEILPSHHWDAEMENLPTYPERGSASAAFLQHISVSWREKGLSERL